MAIKKSDLYSSLWASCDELRGGMDASQYKDYVLFMLFIKYVSDKYGDSDDFAPPVNIPKGASFKDMVALKGKDDIGDKINTQVIRASLLTRLDAATFIVSLRIEPDSPLTQTILLSPDVGPGQIYWLISGHEKPNRGSGAVFIKTGDQPKDLRFASSRPLKRAELGQWHTFAVVHDPANHRVRHFPDGALVKENPLDDTHPLKLRQLVIGNWGFTTEPRNLSGRMDELAVFNRALSDEEIAKF